MRGNWLILVRLSNQIVMESLVLRDTRQRLVMQVIQKRLVVSVSELRCVHHRGLSVQHEVHFQNHRVFYLMLV